MPLSEHEQQLLDQLEKQLRSEDPRFAQNITQPQQSTGVGSITAKQFVIGILALVVGAAVAVGAIYFLDTPFNALGGVVGFAIMVGGGYWAIAGRRSGSAPDAPTGPAKKPGGAKQSASQAGFMDRLEDRWEKRRRGE